MRHNDLWNFYRTLYGAAQEHGVDLAHLESMMVWEKDLFVQMLVDRVNKVKDKA
jgi:hypothetical protein